MKYASTIATAAIILATPVAATPPVVVTAPSDASAVSRHITFADLNLASADGERTLNRRVEYGVGGLCNEAADGNDGGLAYREYMIRCHAVSWDQARPQIASAVQRAREIAATGTSSIVAAAVTISIPTK
jgi:UrcA family protein